MGQVLDNPEALAAVEASIEKEWKKDPDAWDKVRAHIATRKKS